MAAIFANDGLLIESSAPPHIDVDAICAVASNGLALAESLGREIDKGETIQTLLEYQDGVVVLEFINNEAMLILVANDRDGLGQLRFLVALHRYDLIDALEAI